MRELRPVELAEMLPCACFTALVDARASFVVKYLLHPKARRRAVQQPKQREVFVLGRRWRQLDDRGSPVEHLSATIERRSDCAWRRRRERSIGAAELVAETCSRSNHARPHSAQALAETGPRRSNVLQRPEAVQEKGLGAAQPPRQPSPVVGNRRRRGDCASRARVPDTVPYGEWERAPRDSTDAEQWNRRHPHVSSPATVGRPMSPQRC